MNSDRATRAILKQIQQPRSHQTYPTVPRSGSEVAWARVLRIKYSPVK